MRFSGLKMFVLHRCCRSKTGGAPVNPLPRLRVELQPDCEWNCTPTASGIAARLRVELPPDCKRNCHPTASGIAKQTELPPRQLQALCKQRIPRLQTVNKLFYKHIFCICHKVCVFEINNPYFSIILNKIITRNIRINNMMLM